MICTVSALNYFRWLKETRQDGSSSSWKRENRWKPVIGVDWNPIAFVILRESPVLINEIYLLRNIGVCRYPNKHNRVVYTCKFHFNATPMIHVSNNDRMLQTRRGMKNCSRAESNTRSKLLTSIQFFETGKSSANSIAILKRKEYGYNFYIFLRFLQRWSTNYNYYILTPLHRSI